MQFYFTTKLFGHAPNINTDNFWMAECFPFCLSIFFLFYQVLQWTCILKVILKAIFNGKMKGEQEEGDVLRRSGLLVKSGLLGWGGQGRLLVRICTLRTVYLLLDFTMSLNCP